MKECSVSNLTRTLAVLSLLAPVGAYPMGIGEIKLHSALNQNLDAEIALMLSPSERISDVKVSLASPDKFDERGVPWSYFLSNVSFEPTVRADGSAVIRVRSREALKEPILDLLLQVTWPKGTSYRHFSLFVDPPAAYAQPTVPTLQVPESSAAAAPIALTPAAKYVPEASEAASIAPAPAQRARRDAIANGVYGPTRQNDTLWEIAEKASRGHKVSVEQMMIAIYRTNPKAFYKDNMNALQARVKIKIPDREAVIKLSRREALAEIDRQNEAWKNRGQPVSEVAQAEADAESAAPENQLTLAAPAEANVAENAAIAPGQEQNAANSASKEADSTAAISKENADLQARMAAMEEQMAKLQALLTLKEQQLAALQNQAGKTPGLTPAPQQPSPPPAQQEPAPQTAVQPQPPQQNVAGAPPASAQANKAAAPQKTAQQPAPAPEIIEESLPWPLIGGTGAAVLALLGFFWWRRRKAQAEESLMTESMFSPSIIYKAPETDSSFSVPILNDSSSYEVNPVGESSFLSEFTPTDFDAFDNDQNEIDPISEADVYLAYGRYQQAEELIRTAIESYPDRDECKLKLLEIFYASENKAGFDAYVRELALAGKDQDKVFWDKVIDMGLEISPDSPLLAVDPVKHFQNRSEEGLQTVNLDKLQDAFEQDEFDTDFDLSAFDDTLTEVETAEPEQQAIEVEAASDDLDLSAFELEQDAGSGLEHDNNSIEFDLGEFSVEQAPSEIKLEDLGNGLDFDLDSLDFSNDSTTSTQASVDDDLSAFTLEEPEEAGGEQPKSDFDFDFDFSTLGGAGEEEKLGAEDVSDLTDMDELETKLDLAKAYRDMGDNESAKDIVAEVLEKGNVEQKKLAQELLSELS